MVLVHDQVLRDGRALQFASEPLRNDHDVVLAAVVLMPTSGRETRERERETER